MNDIQLALNVLASPAQAFAELRQRPRFWFPFAIGILTSIALIVWYYGLVDIRWLADLMLSADPRTGNLPEDQRDRLLSMLTRNSMLASALMSVVLLIPIMLALQALYFSLAGKITGVLLSYKHWFSMVAWCGLPAVIAGFAGMAVLLTEDAPLQVSPLELQALSLNQLFFHLPFGAPGASLLSTLSLVTPWTWGLLVICVRTWTQRSWLFSATFALLPSVVWYGGWAVLALR